MPRPGRGSYACEMDEIRERILSIHVPNRKGTCSVCAVPDDEDNAGYASMDVLWPCPTAQVVAPQA